MDCRWSQNSTISVSPPVLSDSQSADLHRLLLSYEIMQARKNKSTTDEITLQRKRQILDKRIENHQHESEKFMSAQAVDALSDPADGNPEAWDTDDDEEDPLKKSVETPTNNVRGQFTYSIDPTHTTVVSTLTEKKPIFLPSSTGHEKCIKLGLQGLVKTELALREGQANDALYSIKLLIGEKSFCFRKNLRNAKSKTQKTWSWSGIHSAHKKLKQQRAIYRTAQNAMKHLGASTELLAHYRELKKGDTNASTAIVEPNAW